LQLGVGTVDHVKPMVDSRSAEIEIYERQSANASQEEQRRTPELPYEVCQFGGLNSSSERNDKQRLEAFR
jgi:hypothetical protein